MVIAFLSDKRRVGNFPSLSLNTPAVCLCGTFCPSEKLYHDAFDAVFSIINEPSTLEESIANTTKLFENAAYNVAGLFTALDKNRCILKF